MDNMKSNDDNLKKLNDANLDNVSGGTGTEMYQLTQALGIPFTDLKSVDLDQITSKLAQYGVSAAIGVRGMKLSGDDKLETAVFMVPGESVSYEHKGANIALDRLRIATRDTKGVKK